MKPFKICLSFFFILGFDLVIFTSAFQNAPKNIEILLADSRSFYAQIQSPNVYMYESENGKPLFEIPCSFYVHLLAPKTSNDFYFCEYIQQKGYVKSSEITCVENAPPNPYLCNVNFRILASQSAELRTEPSNINGLNSLICELGLYETNFIYYGKIQGQEVVSMRGDIWYYCSYTKNSQTLLGYIYAGLTDQFKEIYPLSLQIDTISEHNWEEPESSTTLEKQQVFTSLSQNQVLIICGVSAPILLLLLTLFKPIRKSKLVGKKIQSRTQSEKNKKETSLEDLTVKQNKFKTYRKAPKGKDFYEL